MSLERLEDLLDALPGLQRLTLQGLGEPLLAPDLLAMVRAARRRGVAVGFNTNGSLLTPARARALIEAGLSWLRVSLDGATADTLHAIRDGAHFDRIVANLRGLTELQRRLEVDHPDVAVVVVAMRRNVGELADIVELAADCGVGAVRIQNLSHGFDDCDPAGRYAAIRRFAAEQALWGPALEARAREAFDAAREAARRRGVELRLPEAAGERFDPLDGHGAACDRPWNEAYVTHDGTVQPCCMVMGADRLSLGSLEEASFAEIWHGSDYQRFRAGLLPGGTPHEACQGCSVYRHRF